MSIPLWPPCTHPLMATSNRIGSNQYGLTFLKNAFSTLLNQWHVELRQLWRRKGVKQSI